MCPVGIFLDLSFKTCEFSSDYPYIVIHFEDCRKKLNGVIGLPEHEFEFVDLGIADYGNRFAELA